VPATFHENSSAPYDTAEQIELSSQSQRLHIAISHGIEEEVTSLLSSGVSVNTRDGVNNSPLHTAILRGNISIVKSLLNYGANVDAIGFHGKTPLHLADVSKGLVQLLLKHQPNLSLQDNEGNTILHQMLQVNGWWDDLDVKGMIRMILSSGSDINIMNQLGESPLHRIVTDVVPASKEYMEMVSDFLDYKPNVRSPMRNGASLLLVFLENSDIVFSLTGYHLYDHKGELGFRCLEQLLVAGADPDIMFRSKPLVIYFLETIKHHQKNTPAGKFLVLLLQRADIGATDLAGNNMLHAALTTKPRSYGLHDQALPTAIISTLIDLNIDVNHVSSTGASPLEICLDKGWRRPHNAKEVALALVRAGASTTARTSTGKTIIDVLTHFSSHDRICLTKAFLKADIDSQQQESEDAAAQDWVRLWRLTWKQTSWRCIKSHLTDLENSRDRPKIKDFAECSFLVIAEHLLEFHKSRLLLWCKGELDQESVREDYDEYCAILRDCRERNATIDASWYAYLLNLMDFK
jgi:ankyrin repeat protein